MKTQRISEEEQAALTILREVGGSLIEAAMAGRAAIQAGRGQFKRAMRCIMAGAEALKQEEKTVSFAKAVEAAREARKMRRARTQSDFKYITSRFLKRCAGLSKRKIRSIKANGKSDSANTPLRHSSPSRSSVIWNNRAMQK